jgi:hypothetical protein
MPGLCSYVGGMTVVKVSALKKRLSHVLRLVRRGKTADQVIARLESSGDLASTGEEEAARLDDLERRGIVRRGIGKLPPGWLEGRPAVTADVVGALLKDRRS